MHFTFSIYTFYLDDRVWVLYLNPPGLLTRVFLIGLVLNTTATESVGDKCILISDDFRRVEVQGHRSQGRQGPRPDSRPRRKILRSVIKKSFAKDDLLLPWYMQLGHQPYLLMVSSGKSWPVPRNEKVLQLSSYVNIQTHFRVVKLTY